jgi:magnesium-transporting ATPase (P-type)
MSSPDKSLRRVNALGEDHPRDYKINVIKTSKYTLLTFLPKNLIEQFSKLANVYFLLITFMQMIPIISISGGKPVMLLPLLVVIGVSMIKDIFEDFKRHRSDKAENFKEVSVYDKISKEFVKQHWKDVKVGQLVKINCDEFFPADMVFMQSSERKGICYVETKNLDGETNLKHKLAEKCLHERLNNYDIEEAVAGHIVCEMPNDQIYKFEGTYY